MAAPIKQVATRLAQPIHTHAPETTSSVTTITTTVEVAAVPADPIVSPTLAEAEVIYIRLIQALATKKITGSQADMEMMDIYKAVAADVRPGILQLIRDVAMSGNRMLQMLADLEAEDRRSAQQ